MKTILLKVPLFAQSDNRSGEGYRECMSSACAMIAAYYGRVRSDDEYNTLRAKRGDTTEALAHITTLQTLDLTAVFTRSMTQQGLEGELSLGRPVAVGWLHQGPVEHPKGFGHWSVVGGVSDNRVFLLDPMGDPDLIRGGFVTQGRGWEGWCSWRNWAPRWDTRAEWARKGGGIGLGWAIRVRPVEGR